MIMRVRMGGVLLRSATQDGELAERAVRFASSDQGVRYDKAVRKGGVRGVVDLAGLLGEDQAHGTGTKGEFVNTAQRGLREELGVPARASESSRAT